MPTVNTYGQRKVATQAMPGVRKSAAETDESTGVGLDQARAQSFDALGRLGAQMTGTVLAINKQHLEIRDAEAKRADQVAALDFENGLATWTNKFLYDPKDGALTKSGRDSYLLPEVASTEFEKVTGELTAKLGTDKQRVAAQRIAQQHGQQLDLTLRRHVLGEMRKDEAATVEANVSNSLSSGIANSQDPPTIYRELDKAQETVRAYGQRNGQGPEEIQQNVGKVTTKMHAGVIEQLLALEKPKLAQAWFAGHKDDIGGEARANLERKLEVGTAQQDGLKASEAIWQAVGPKGETDAINLDTMETAARAKFADDPKTLDATIRYLRERKAGVDAGRADRAEATSGAVWIAVGQGADLATVSKMKEFLALPGKAQLAVQEHIISRAEHRAALAASLESRAAAAESREYTRGLREEKTKETATWARYWEIAKPDVLHATSENQIQSLRGTMGDDHVNQLLAQKRKLEDPNTYKGATIDNDAFRTIAEGAGLKGYTAKTEDEKAALGQLRDMVETAIDQESFAQKKQLTREQKNAVMHSIVDRKVMLNQWGPDHERIAATVKEPDDRAKVYVPLAKVPARALSDYLNYARSLPGAERMNDAELQRRFGSRIERAYGLASIGSTRAEIEAVMKGQQ